MAQGWCLKFNSPLGGGEGCEEEGRDDCFLPNRCKFTAIKEHGLVKPWKQWSLLHSCSVEKKES